jgi:hypothetical protein
MAYYVYHATVAPSTEAEWRLAVRDYRDWVLRVINEVTNPEPLDGANMPLSQSIPYQEPPDPLVSEDEDHEPPDEAPNDFWPEARDWGREGLRWGGLPWHIPYDTVPGPGGPCPLGVLGRSDVFDNCVVCLF